MKLRKVSIEGIVVIEPAIFGDSRGYFFESYNERTYQEAGIHHRFVQDNQSRSAFGVIRGLHMQIGEHAQTKLVRVLSGAIYDVAADLRTDSPTYGEWFGMEISDENHLQLLIPKGFAHGFSVLSQTATILYKCDAYYNRASERGIRYDDPQLGIDWKIPEEQVILSDKDKMLPYLANDN
jgi:dTDP-4-dehydrorhamnose 3,5-epimerase